jgi:hypothetical protein
MMKHKLRTQDKITAVNSLYCSNSKQKNAKLTRHKMNDPKRTRIYLSAKNRASRKLNVPKATNAHGHP